VGKRTKDSLIYFNSDRRSFVLVSSVVEAGGERQKRKREQEADGSNSFSFTLIN
jgi:hypothetical protein